jgi:hypothetical protein
LTASDCRGKAHQRTDSGNERMFWSGREDLNLRVPHLRSRCPNGSPLRSAGPRKSSGRELSPRQERPSRKVRTRPQPRASQAPTWLEWGFDKSLATTGIQTEGAGKRCLARESRRRGRSRKSSRRFDSRRRLTPGTFPYLDGDAEAAGDVPGAERFTVPVISTLNGVHPAVLAAPVGATE